MPKPNQPNPQVLANQKQSGVSHSFTIHWITWVERMKHKFADKFGSSFKIPKLI